MRHIPSTDAEWITAAWLLRRALWTGRPLGPLETEDLLFEHAEGVMVVADRGPHLWSLMAHRVVEIRDAQVRSNGPAVAFRIGFSLPEVGIDDAMSITRIDPIRSPAENRRTPAFAPPGRHRPTRQRPSPLGSFPAAGRFSQAVYYRRKPVRFPLRTG